MEHSHSIIDPNVTKNKMVWLGTLW
jgi:hypothetical protein